MKQIDFTKFLNDKNLKKRLVHGGQHALGKRKDYRPLTTKHSIHLVLRSHKAIGPLSFRHKRNKQLVEQILKKQARRFMVKICDFANVGNHLHLEIKILARKEFQGFLKSVTCLIARKITGARRGLKFGRFWDHLAFTRVLTSFVEQKILSRYILANKIEAIGGPFARARFIEYWYG